MLTETLDRFRPVRVNRVKALAAVVGLAAASIAVGFYQRGNQIVSYPFVTIALSSVGYLLLHRHAERTYPVISTRSLKAVDGILLLSIAGLMAIGRSTYGMAKFPEPYYGLFVVIGTAIGVRILFGHLRLVIVELVLFTLGTRVIIWNHAPIIGADSRLHVGLVGYIVTTGELIPSSTTYYHWFPISHVLAASISLIGNLPSAVSLFLATGLIASLALLPIYLLTARVLLPEHGNKSAAFAVLLVALSSFHRGTASLPIAQSLGTAMVPWIMYLLYFRSGKREIFLSFVLFFVVLFTHNLTPLLIIALSLSILAALLLIDRFHRSTIDRYYREGIDRFSEPRQATRYLVSAFGITTLMYFVYSYYVRFVVTRVNAILEGGDSVRKSAADPSGGSLPSTDLLVQVDPILQMGGDVLVLAFLAVIVGYLLLENLSRRTLDRFPTGLTVLTLIFFLGFTLLAFMGQQGVARAFPTLIWVIAPLCGYVVYRLSHDQSLAALGLVALVLVSSGYFGVANPIGAPLEDTESMAVLEASHVEGIEFAGELRKEVYTDRYMAGTGESLSIDRGQVGDTGLRGYQSELAFDSRTMINYTYHHPNQPFLYRGVLTRSSSAYVPSCYSRLYSSGTTDLVFPKSCREEL